MDTEAMETMVVSLDQITLLDMVLHLPCTTHGEDTEVMAEASLADYFMDGKTCV